MVAPSGRGNPLDSSLAMEPGKDPALGRVLQDAGRSVHAVSPRYIIQPPHLTPSISPKENAFQSVAALQATNITPNTHAH